MTAQQALDALLAIPGPWVAAGCGLLVLALVWLTALEGRSPGSAGSGPQNLSADVRDAFARYQARHRRRGRALTRLTRPTTGPSLWRIELRRDRLRDHGVAPTLSDQGVDAIMEEGLRRGPRKPHYNHPPHPPHKAAENTGNRNQTGNPKAVPGPQSS